MEELEKEWERRLDECIKPILNKDHLSEYIQQAENGDVLAQRILGDIYFYGITVNSEYWRNLDHAVWYAKLKGNFALISECYDKPNYDEALKWYKMAAKNGDVRSKEQIEKILNNVPNSNAGQAIQLFVHKEMRLK